MSTLTHTPVTRPVVGYSPLLTTEETLDLTHYVVEQVHAQGYTPVAASMSGSRLQGLDHADSDSDVLVVVAEKPQQLKSLSRTATLKKSFCLSDELEGQLVSVHDMMNTLDTSVPWVELRQSPFLLADIMYAPMLLRRPVSKLLLSVHADRFAVHAVSRAAQGHSKAAHNALAAYQLVQTLNPTLSRHDVAPGGPLAHRVADHLDTVFSDYMENPEHFTSHKDQQVREENLTAVTQYLRGEKD